MYVHIDIQKRKKPCVYFFQLQLNQATLSTHTS